MRRAVVLIIAVLTQGVAYANHIHEAPIFTAAEQQWINAHPVVRYAIDPYWPMEYLEEGELKGLTRDYIDYISSISGLRFQLIQTESWSDTLTLMKKNQVDLSTAINRNLFTKSDLGGLILSDEYFVGSTIIVTRSGDPVMFSPKKLNGKTVAVKGGGGYERYLTKNFPDIDLLLITDPEQALEALADGRADAVVGLDVVLQPIITRKFLGTLHLAGVISEMAVVSVMGINSSSPELASIINKSLASITSEASDIMFDRWLAKTKYGAPSWGAILRYYSIELAAILLFIIAIILLASRAKRAQNTAQRSEADKTAFLAMMSHEIRTPMNGVLSSIELLQSTELNPSQHELATLANVSARNLLEMLDDVLDISKLEARGVSIEYIPTDLSQLARGLADIHRLGALNRKTSLNLNIVGLEEVLLLVDPIRIRQIISNLLSNAVKFTHNGEVILSLEFHPSGPDIGRLKVQVSDTGIGIDQAQQGRLFQAFVQADNSITRRYGGSGLGLSICKQLVELMGGRIYLESDLGKGTQVSCWLHVHFIYKVACTESPALEQQETPTTAATQKQVLVVEDHPINQRTIGLQLTELGYRALIVEDGVAALAAMQESRDDIAIVLLDCHLPDMDGYEVARRIRQQENNRSLAHMPIIAISASTDEAHQLKCFESGIDGNLSKPLGLSNLKQLFAVWLLASDLPVPSVQSTEDTLSLHDLFIKTSREDAALLRDAFETGDLVCALHYAHRLHGSALTIGDNELATWAKELEDSVRNPGTVDHKWARRLEIIEAALDRLSENTVVGKT
ncbi:ATP-binding protein [Pseudomonas sp. IPO3774]|uniref:ATP-binding protein n=1 Tax=Pseudomonas sp. IPO3774 TaxID=2738826 RepID=UPI0015A35926|nr:ATP-binding protein [Pseudomonas sp. IPO3774]NWD65963.1 transporter substrate-binding domain-containing protein [Pseudomonas sp. IPO3774]